MGSRWQLFDAGSVVVQVTSSSRRTRRSAEAEESVSRRIQVSTSSRVGFGSSETDSEASHPPLGIVEGHGMVCCWAVLDAVGGSCRAPAGPHTRPCRILHHGGGASRVAELAAG